MARQFTPLFMLGVIVLLVGASGSLAHHASVPAGAIWLCSLLGQSQPSSAVQSFPVVQTAIDRLAGSDGGRAHLVVFIGMLITTADLVRRGTRQNAG